MPTVPYCGLVLRRYCGLRAGHLQLYANSHHRYKSIHRTCQSHQQVLFIGCHERHFSTDKPDPPGKPPTGSSSSIQQKTSNAEAKNSTKEPPIAATRGLQGEPEPAPTQDKKIKIMDPKDFNGAFNLGTGEIGQTVNKENVRLQGKKGPLTFEEARLEAQKMYEERKKSVGDYFDRKIASLRIIFSGEPNLPRTPDEEWYYKRVSFWMRRYEDFIGLTDVKASQARVVEWQKKFIQMQEKRRDTQQTITEVQKKIKDIHSELEKTSRGEDRYLILVTQEHQVLKEERSLQEEFVFYEKGERECFNHLSNAVRDSHEKERAQAERTKYWSVLGSIIGTCLGILGTTINNRLRMRELRQLVVQNNTVEEIKTIGEELTAAFAEHKTHLNGLTGHLEKLVGEAAEGVKHTNHLTDTIQTLRTVSDNINIKTLEDSLHRLQERQDYLSQLITKHEEILDEKVEGIKSDLFVGNTNISKLTHIQMKDRERELKSWEEREKLWKKSIEMIKSQQTSLVQSLNSQTREIDEKMKDIRSLLLDQHQMIPKFDSTKMLERLGKLEEVQKRVLNVSGSSKGGSAGKATLGAELSVTEEELEHLLDRHHAKTRQTLILSTLVVAFLTPIAVYSFNHVM